MTSVPLHLRALIELQCKLQPPTGGCRHKFTQSGENPDLGRSQANFTSGYRPDPIPRPIFWTCCASVALSPVSTVVP